MRQNQTKRLDVSTELLPARLPEPPVSITDRQTDDGWTHATGSPTTSYVATFHTFFFIQFLCTSSICPLNVSLVTVMRCSRYERSLTLLLLLLLSSHHRFLLADKPGTHIGNMLENKNNMMMLTFLQTPTWTCDGFKLQEKLVFQRR